MSNNSGDGLMWGVIILFLILYWIVMIIIEYFVFFLILGIGIWAIYYYTTNAPKWEEQRKRRVTFAKNNTTSHTNFKVLYATAEHNIKVLSSSCFALPDNYTKLDNAVGTEFFDLNFKEDIVRFTNRLKSVSRFQVQPHNLYEEGMAVNHNPYISATKTVSSLIDDTIKIPNMLISLEKICDSLQDKEINPHRSDRFFSILTSISSNFTVDNYRRLHLVYNAQMVEVEEKSTVGSPVSTTEA